MTSVQASDGATKARAGLAGAGGGTGLVAVAESLPVDPSVKSLLVYAAPTVAVLFGSLVLFAQVQMSRYLQQRLVKRVRRDLEECLKNPHTSDEHKKRIRDRLEDLENVVTIQDIERIKVIATGK